MASARDPTDAGTDLRLPGSARACQGRIGTVKHMKRFSQFFSAALALLLALVLLTGCAGDAPAPTVPGTEAPETKPPVRTDAAPESTAAPLDTAPAEISGETLRWGVYSVLVPEGFELKTGEDASYCDFCVQKSDFFYIGFITEEDDELLMQKYNYNKNTYTNEQVDVEGVCGKHSWTGFQYSDGWGGWGFEVYTSLGEKLVRVSGVGYAFDSPVAQAVLSSFDQVMR